MTEDQDLEQNGIKKDSAAHHLYKQYRANGMSQKDAIERVVDGISGLKSDSLPKEDLERLKIALFKIKGQMY